VHSALRAGHCGHPTIGPAQGTARSAPAHPAAL